MSLNGASISVLDADRELRHVVARHELAVAGANARVHVLSVPVGDWNPPPAFGAGGFGLLVIDGLFTRAARLLGRTSMELIGKEDLIRPWEEPVDALSVSYQVSWTVVREARLAVLDEAFARRVAPWPAIGAALAGRSAQRARWLAWQVAMLENPRLDVRLMLLFWHLADRWGRVGPEGVVVPIPLTHRTLGRLVRAHRPSVTASLRDLADRDMLISSNGDGWILRGDPNEQLRVLSERR
jgi:CRP/FNR family transcriptional regulator, cyclic AMP receptor protein